MLTLSIDTASHVCGVALWEGRARGRLRAERELPMTRGHGEALFGVVAEALEDASVRPRDIDRFAAVRGPGTFTGLRIGLAAIRGLALALGADALAITAFELIAASDSENHREHRSRIVAIDARRGEVYVAILGPDSELASPPSALTPHKAADLATPECNLVIGSGAAAVLKAATARGQLIETREVAHPPARLLARLAAEREPTRFPPEPLYIRAPDAKLPEKSPLRRVRS